MVKCLLLGESREIVRSEKGRSVYIVTRPRLISTDDACGLWCPAPELQPHAPLREIGGSPGTENTELIPYEYDGQYK